MGKYEVQEPKNKATEKFPIRRNGPDSGFPHSPLSCLLRSLLITTACLFAIGCSTKPSHKLKVVASTTLISSIVEAVGGEYVKVATIAPAGLCPGHFDIPPSAVAAANDAHLLLNHGWEEWLAKLEQAVHNPKLVKRTLETKGNWMVPDIHKKAVAEILQLLVETDTAHADTFRLTAKRYQAQVDSAAAEARTLFAGRTLPKTIAAEHQTPFLRWLGFPVVATYGRPEEFSAQELVRLARMMADSGVTLVVDNLQSGPDAGKPLAEAHGARQVTLTNFPLHGIYCRTLLDNARALAAALPLEPSTP